jgi:uncharacterized Zn-finger protein
MTISTTAPQHQDIIDVDGADLPVSCPGPHTAVWNLHPKVFLDVTKTGEAHCPYCGAHYRLKPGTKVHAH